MCGIAGFIDSRGGDHGRQEALARAMGDALYHRGPDGGDIWTCPENGVAFSHRRLAIVDLSDAGLQPMTSACGRYVMLYNGEIFNAEELRPELVAQRGINFRGHSDSEVILEGFAAWGVRATLERLIGQFAIALWDKREKRLTLCRDRLGIKPLYWSLENGLLLFGSELKALKVHPGCPTEIDRDALTAYLRHSYIPAPHSLYKGVQKLLPGHMLTLDVADMQVPRIEAFWSLEDAVRAGQASPFTGNDEEAVDALEALLKDSVKRRMIADVPLGAFLSGGIDSSTIAALMQCQSERPVRTFSIGFHEQGYNEAQHAAEVARHLGTEHTELYVTPEEAREVIPKLPAMYDEPFADSSQIPTFLVAQMTRQHVTVALSGDGGDELFGGYRRYITAQTHGGRINSLPRPLRHLGAAAIRTLPPQAWNTLFKAVPTSRRPSHPGDSLYKLAGVLGEDAEGYYRKLVSINQRPEELTLGGDEPHGPLWDPRVKELVPDPVARMAYLDCLTYLPDDILTKVDRATMATSLEGRVPILDHRVVEFSWSLPGRVKIRDGQGKWILRQVLNRHVPRELVERPKVGFGVPIDAWLRGPLKDWAADLLSEECLKRQGLLNPAPIQRMWQEHLSGRRNWQHQLWNVLMMSDL